MSGETGWGIGRGVNGNEAASEAARQALRQLEVGRPAFGLVVYSRNFKPEQILNGLKSTLGSTPIWGLSTICPFTSDGESQQSVLVGLVGGSGLKASVHWLSATTPDEFAPGLRKGVEESLADLIARAPGAGGALLAPAGSGNSPSVTTAIQRALQRMAYPIAGGLDAETCLAANDLPANAKSIGNGNGPRTASIGRPDPENKTGADGLAFATLGGRFRMGVGYGNGWQSMGILLRVTKARDEWVLGLNGRTPAEVYGKIFGYPPEDWSFSPLREMTRLYPFGIETENQDAGKNGGLVIHAPEWVESNGSFRMSAPIHEGVVVRLMVGDRKKCVQAGQGAARQALECMNRRGSAHPLLGMVFADINWRYLFQNNLNIVMESIRSQIGAVPLLGIYTTGQIAGQGERSGVDFLNGNISVVVIGESER